MEKCYEKKNFGIPVMVLSLLAYLIGYLLISTISYGLLLSMIFAAAIFGFEFEDKVKRAFMQSFIIAVLIRVLSFAISLFDEFAKLVSPRGTGMSVLNSTSKLEDLMDVYDLNWFHIILQYISKYCNLIVQVAAIVIFMVFIIQTLRNKEVSIPFINKIIDKNSGNPCAKCGKSNKPDTTFCGSCGNKLE